MAERAMSASTWSLTGSSAAHVFQALYFQPVACASKRHQSDLTRKRPAHAGASIARTWDEVALYDYRNISRLSFFIGVRERQISLSNIFIWYTTWSHNWRRNTFRIRRLWPRCFVRSGGSFKCDCNRVVGPAIHRSIGHAPLPQDLPQRPQHQFLEPEAIRKHHSPLFAVKRALVSRVHKARMCRLPLPKMVPAARGRTIFPINE